MKKTLAMILAVVMLMTACVAGTLAWLQDSTQEVKNTFTVGNIDITLEETGTTTDDNGVDTKSYKMIPGATLSKDPKVTVEAGSEKCWLFVEITKSANFNDYLTYAVADNWEVVEENGNVVVYGYKTIIDASAADVPQTILKDNQVTVKTDVTKTMMDNLTEATYPTLTFKAYAIQSENLGETVTTADAAWDVYNAA